MECLAVVIPNVMNRTDVWVVQSGSGLGFPLEASQGLRVSGRNSSAEESQRNKSMRRVSSAL